MSDRRILFTADSRFALRPTADGGPGQLVGYGIVWNHKSSDRGGYKVVLAPGSARFESPSFALWNHNYDYPLARNDNGTMAITSDDYGVQVTINLPNTTTGRDVAELVRSGIVRGMSFGMILTGATFTTATDSEGDEVDTFSSFGVDELTITPIPAFTGTSIGVANPDSQLSRKASKPAPAPDYADEARKQLWELEFKRLSTYACTVAEHHRGDK